MIKDACLIGNNIINTGKECDTSMVATAMLIAVPPDFSFTLEDIESDPVGWITPFLHAPIGERVYPFFGLKAPINNITNNAGSDTIVTLDDGTPVFLRYGLYTKTFETIAGGLCYAKVLQGLNKSGYNIIEIDQTGQMLVGVNPDGSFRGLITQFMYAPAPKQADLKTNPYLNQFQLSYSPIELVQNGKILSGASPLLQLMGLIDAEVVKAGTPVASVAEVKATRTIKITSLGTDGDTIDPKGIDGQSLTGGPVVQTSSESTVDLLAAKIAAAINSHTSTNGGYTATVATDTVTEKAPAGLGSSVNGVDQDVTIVGDIEATKTAYSGGVSASGAVYIKVRTECAKSDITSKFGDTVAAENFVATVKDTGVEANPTSTDIVDGAIELTGHYSSGVTYRFKGAAPNVWLDNGVEGYDAEDHYVDITMP